MSEENMKNYSIRLGSTEIGVLDALAEKHFYWKRSGCIRGILLAVFKAVSFNQVYDLIRFGFGYSGIEVTITINKK